MSVLISGGSIVNADRTFAADVICNNGRIEAVVGIVKLTSESIRGE